MYYPFLVYPSPVYYVPFMQPIFPQSVCHPVYPTFHTPYIRPAGGGIGYPDKQSETTSYELYSRQQYEEVDPAIFHQSAKSFQPLMDDGNTLLDKLSESESFAAQVMDAAQRSDEEKVKQLIESAGLQGTVTTRFNPDSITITLDSDDESKTCCKLSMSLRWR